MHIYIYIDIYTYIYMYCFNKSPHQLLWDTMCIDHLSHGFPGLQASAEGFLSQGGVATFFTSET